MNTMTDLKDKLTPSFTDTNNNNPNWGTPLNPYNNDYYCGGSSGGSAYTVAAGLVPFSIAADGGGSIRIPSKHVLT